MNRIKQLRKSKHITMEQLALSIGVGKPTVSRWESEKILPTLENWQALADYFNVSVPYLQGLDQIWYQAECLECHKVFRISSQDADKVKCCPFCKKFYLAISKAS